jgi:osmotically-inducible protein OsmY
MKIRATWALLALLACGCGQKDVQVLRRLGSTASEKFQLATGLSRGRLAGGMQAVRGSLGDKIDSRVATRLHWDKHLDAAKIRVRNPAPGTVRLEGSVLDATHRERALDLARSTSGVEQVIDDLEVRPVRPASR